MSTEGTTEAAPEPNPGDNERGNPEPAFVEDEIAQAMAEAQAAEDAKKDAEMRALMGEPEQADGPEAEADETPDEQPEAKADDETKESKDEAKAEPDEDEAASRYALRRKRRKLEREMQRLEEQRKQYEAARPLMEIQDLIRSGKLTEAANRMAGMAGTSPEQFYLKLTEAQLTDGESEALEQGKLTPAQVEKMVEERIRAREEAQRQQQQARYLHTRVEELASIGKHESLAKRFPYLGALPEGKLVAEMQQAVEFAAGNPQYQHLLSDTVAFAEELNKLQRQELTETIERLNKVDPEALRELLSSYGHGLSAKPDGAQPPAPKKAKAAADASSRRTTITDADTSDVGGATREMSDEEKLEALTSLLAR